MKPVRAVTLSWALLLVSRLEATRKGSPEEASFYYGTFPLGTSIPLLVHPSVCQLAHRGWLAKEFGVLVFLTGRMGQVTPYYCSKINKAPNRFL